MKNDYLWDGEGTPDADVARLEQVLRPLRHRPAPLEMPAARPRISPASAADRVTWRGGALLLTLAATLVLLVRVTWHEPGPPPSSAWMLELASVTGRPTSAHEETALTPNRWIVVGSRIRARLKAEDVGVVEVEPGSRIRLLSATNEQHRLALSVGVLHAQIWARPGRFYVETPSAMAIDLGCAYTLEVDGSGASHLHVTAGWVGLASDGHEAFVPAGAVCTTTPEGVAGTPRRAEANPTFSRALDALDGTPGAVRGNVLDVVLGEARARDAFSLWHLLTRLDRASAAKVYERLAILAPPPPQVTRDRILNRDRIALDAWWDSFGIGDSRWYRTFRAGSRRR